MAGLGVGDVVYEFEENVPETGMSVEIESELPTGTSETLYCFCQQPWGKDFMIMCDNCKEWFHGACVGIAEVNAMDIDKYHCEKCVPTVGKTIHKKVGERPIQAGSELFIEKLRDRVFVSADEIVCRERGQNLNLPNLIMKGFTRPILVDEMSGLGMKVPPESFTVKDVERFVGPGTSVEVIDVATQKTVTMTLGEFVDYFTDPCRTYRYNLISLEVSDSNLGNLIEPPYIARKLDWVANTWPSNLSEELYMRPKVQKYCLIGSKDSYTDFHIDFGGTSVWYHVLWGEKVFYLIEPTDMNLALYEKWMTSSPKDKYESFFADTVDYCYKLVLRKGQTMFIPTGWIHGVLTTMDSLVFGGNFLHSLNMDMQLKIYNVERKLNIRKNYMFPSFEIVHWFAAEKIVQDLSSYNSHGSVPIHLRRGTQSLIKSLTNWYQKAKERVSAKDLVPPMVDPHGLIKRLTRELKHAEKRYHHSSSNSVGAGSSTVVFDPQTQESDETTGVKPIKLLISGVPAVDVKSPVSPSQSSQSTQGPSIKIKIKKQPSRSASIQSSPSYSSSIHEDGATFGMNGTSQSPPGQISPRDGTLKIRLSLSEARVELLDGESNYSPNPVNHYSIEDTRDSGSGLRIDTDTDGETKSRKSKEKKSHRKKKCKNHHRRKEQQALLDSAMNGGSPGLFVSSVHGAGNDLSDYSSKAGRSHDHKKRSHKKKKRTRSSSGTSDNPYHMLDGDHQDAEYVYPGLTASDDEDVQAPKGRKRSKQDRDDSWCPGIKVAKSATKVERNARPNAKKEAVQVALSRAKMSTTFKSGALKKKYASASAKPAKEPKLTLPKKKVETSSKSSEQTSESSSGLSPKQHPQVSSSTSTNNGKSIRRPRKGMATPKQRLSKILKMNKF